MDDMIYWIWLSLACTPDTATFPRLIEKFGDAKSIYEADIKSITKVIDPRSSNRTALADKDLEKAQSVLDFARKYKVGLLPYSDEKYPAALRSIPTPPVLLYYRGILPDFSKYFSVAIVGTRSLSSYGRRNAFKLSYDLATAGALVVSGMAKGIDGVAHAGALAAGMPTVAILGSGINVCYPTEHTHLAREIVKTGCVLTEYPPNAKPTKLSFPQRNRIISGLSRATLVIEGAERSGATITARHAEKQGRAIYAVPGNIGAKTSEATNLLIKNGAKICTRAEDIIEDFDKNETAHLLNPFKLNDRLPVDMHSKLAEYKIAAVCANDDIFIPPVARKRRQPSPAIENKQESKSTEGISRESGTPTPDGDNSPVAGKLGAEALAIYKKIPASGECEVEELADDSCTLGDVMKHLIDLEALGFVRFSPGGTVMRKHNS